MAKRPVSRHGNRTFLCPKYEGNDFKRTPTGLHGILKLFWRGRLKTTPRTKWL